MNRQNVREVLDCASPVELSRRTIHRLSPLASANRSVRRASNSGRGLPHSKRRKCFSRQNPPPYVGGYHSWTHPGRRGGDGFWHRAPRPPVV